MYIMYVLVILKVMVFQVEPQTMAGQNFTVLNFTVARPWPLPLGLPDAERGEEPHKASGV